MTAINEHSSEAHQRHAAEVAALLSAVLYSPGFSEPAMRDAAFRGGSLPPPFTEYVARILGESYRITDDHIDKLLAAGYTEDAIFEITVAAALGAASQRLEAGLRALQQDG